MDSVLSILRRIIVYILPQIIDTTSLTAYAPAKRQIATKIRAIIEDKKKDKSLPIQNYKIISFNLIVMGFPLIEYVI